MTRFAFLAWRVADRRCRQHRLRLHTRSLRPWLLVVTLHSSASIWHAWSASRTFFASGWGSESTSCMRGRCRGSQLYVQSRSLTQRKPRRSKDDAQRRRARRSTSGNVGTALSVSCVATIALHVGSAERIKSLCGQFALASGVQRRQSSLMATRLQISWCLQLGFLLQSSHAWRW